MFQTFKRPHSTQPKHRSFFIDKKSTISTRQTSRQFAKSFIIKHQQIKSVQKPKQLQNLSQSTPIEVYFNPQYRSNYIKKVIDTFFVNLNNDRQQVKNQKPQNDSTEFSSFVSPNKLSIRSRLKEQKKRKPIHNQFSQFETGKFVRSSPKKSIVSDLQEEKSMAIITDDNKSIEFQNQISFSKDNQVQNSLINNDSNLFKSIKEFTNYSKLRPLTQQNKRRKITKPKQSITSPVNQSFSVSIFFNEKNSPRQKMRKQIRKLVQQNQYFQEYAVYEEKKLKYKVRKYKNISTQINPMYQRQDKIRKKGIKSLWDYTKFQQTLQYPLTKSIKQMISEQFTYGNNDLDRYIQIYPKMYYNKLFQNKNQQLIDIIVSMTKLIVNNKGKILISGGFNLKNLFRIDQKQFYLKDLGGSAILQQIKIRDKTIKHLYQPIWRQDGPKGKWLVAPQLIAPECLESYFNRDFSWIQSEPQAVMAAQIWSLGCMILQLLTLIPLNSNIRCRIKTQNHDLRRGYLSANGNDINLFMEQLKRKQNYLQNILRRKIQIQLAKIPLEQKVLRLLRKMIVYDPKKRVMPHDIFKQLA